MQNRPTKEELLEGVSRFLREEAVTKLEGRAQFHARVAARAAEMVLRELKTGDESLQREAEGLCDLLGLPPEGPAESAALAERVRNLNQELVTRIAEGRADEGDFRRATIDHLRRVTLDRLGVNNPAMAETVREEIRHQSR